MTWRARKLPTGFRITFTTVVQLMQKQMKAQLFHPFSQKGKENIRSQILLCLIIFEPVSGKCVVISIKIWNYRYQVTPWITHEYGHNNNYSRQRKPHNFILVSVPVLNQLVNQQLMALSNFNRDRQGTVTGYSHSQHFRALFITERGNQVTSPL